MSNYNFNKLDNTFMELEVIVSTSQLFPASVLQSFFTYKILKEEAVKEEDKNDHFTINLLNPSLKNLYILSNE